MNNIIILHNLVEKNGKTIKENNLLLKHKIKIGTLVEVINLENYEGVRLYVVAHTRDCDGTPLYSLCADKTNIKQERDMFGNYGWDNGYSENNLKKLENEK
jgi:hypothetical protein